MAKLCVLVLAMWSAAHLAGALQTKEGQEGPLHKLQKKLSKPNEIIEDAMATTLNDMQTKEGPLYELQKSVSNPNAIIEVAIARTLNVAPDVTSGTLGALVSKPMQSDEPPPPAEAEPEPSVEPSTEAEPEPFVEPSTEAEPEPSVEPSTETEPEPSLDLDDENLLALLDPLGLYFVNVTKEMNFKLPIEEKLLTLLDTGSKLLSFVGLVADLSRTVSQHNVKKEEAMIEVLTKQLRQKMREAVAITPEPLKTRVASELDMPVVHPDFRFPRKSSVDKSTNDKLAEIERQVSKLAEVMDHRKDELRKVSSVDRALRGFTSGNKMKTWFSAFYTVAAELIEMDVDQHKSIKQVMEEQIKLKVKEANEMLASAQP